MNYLIFSLLFSLFSIASTPKPSELGQTLDNSECVEWVDSVFNSLDQRQRVAQLMVPMVSPNQGQASKNTIKKYVQENQVGGILFSAGNLQPYAEMTNYAQELSQVPLLMTLDGEWGLSMRIPDSPRFPHNMGLGAIQDKDLLYQYGQEVARECQAMGIHVNFAPVLDVNSNPANPVIGYRSFGEDPKRVSDLGVAYSLGLEDGGVMAVAKHFPGHGDTSTDSHKTLPIVNHGRDILDSVDLRPFRDFIKARCGGIMVGHISLPALDQRGWPASMSEIITTGLLRDELGFEGLVFTDGLGMQGAKVAGNNCVSALKAGADVLLGPINVQNDLNAIMQAIEAEELTAEEINSRCKKILAYKYALGVHKQQPIDLVNIDSVVNAPEARDLIQRLADASITVLQNKNNKLPLGDLANNNILLVNIGADNGTDFETMCRRYADIDVVNATHLSSKLSKMDEYNTVIAAVYNDSLSSRTALQHLSKVPGLVSVFMVNPYKMGKFHASLGNADALVIAYDNIQETQKAAAKALFGGIEVDGRLPVNVKGVAPIGTGIDLGKSRLGFSSLLSAGINPKVEEQIDSVLSACVKNGAFPGCQLVVARHGDIIIDKCYGRTTASGEKVTPFTLYDMASVSKTIGTLPGVMKAYDQGLLNLDQPVSEVIPGMKVEGKDDITPMMLLYHETGIAPSLNLYNLMIDTLSYKGKLTSGRKDRLHPVKIYNGFYGQKGVKMRTDIAAREKSSRFPWEAAKGIWVGQETYDTIMNRIYNSKVRSSRDYLYSCLNFSLLMDLEQRLTGQPHQQWVTDSVWGPMGAYSLCYRPTESRPKMAIASTEYDSYLRKQHLKGYVHDELCAFSGGIQGNAGVFGTATDVAKLCQMWLNLGQYGDAIILKPETVRLFTQSKTPNSRRGLGFDKPDIENPENSPTCAEAGASVYGHTGYTGTVFWVDPDKDLIFVFLCNRVDPSRNNVAFSKSGVRPLLMSLIYKAIEN